LGNRDTSKNEQGTITTMKGGQQSNQEQKKKDQQWEKEDAPEGEKGGEKLLQTNPAVNLGKLCDLPDEGENTWGGFGTYRSKRGEPFTSKEERDRQGGSQEKHLFSHEWGERNTKRTPPGIRKGHGIPTKKEEENK